MFVKYLLFCSWSYIVLAQGSSHSGPLLAPAEVLIAIHGIDPDRDGIPLKKARLFFFLVGSCSQGQ